LGLLVTLINVLNGMGFNVMSMPSHNKTILDVLADVD
jgi:Holliday junction resolvase